VFPFFVPVSEPPVFSPPIFSGAFFLPADLSVAFYSPVGFFSGRFVRRLFFAAAFFFGRLVRRLFSLPSSFCLPCFLLPLLFCLQAVVPATFSHLFLWDGRRRDSLRTRPEGLFQRFFAANVTKLLNIFKIFIKYLRNSKTPRIFAVKF